MIGVETALRSPVSSMTSTPAACGAVAASLSNNARRRVLIASASHVDSDRKNCRRWTTAAWAATARLGSRQCGQRLVAVARQEQALEIVSEPTPLCQRAEQRIKLGSVLLKRPRARYGQGRRSVIVQSLRSHPASSVPGLNKLPLKTIVKFPAPELVTIEFADLLQMRRCITRNSLGAPA